MPLGSPDQLIGGDSTFDPAQVNRDGSAPRSPAVLDTVITAGAVIVTTPQDIALLDARKALKMFEKVEVPVLGIVENMARHICSSCGHEEHIFGTGGGQRMADQYGVPYLGSLPLDIRIREQADGGTPTVAAMPDSDLAARYREIARNTAGRLARQPRNKSLGLGKIVVQGAPSA